MKLTKADVERIENEVKKGELVTQGEIVPVLLSSCDDYIATNLYLSLVLSLGSLLVTTFLELELFTCCGVAFIAAVIGYLLGSISAIKRALTGSEVVSTEVHEKAMSLFIENNLHHTKDRNGILIMVSLLEHRVEIVADKGINDKMKEGSWDEIVAKLISSIKKDELVDGICMAIRMCSDQLAENFPAKEENPNELSNKLVTDLYTV